jgi:hypothetical protein
MHPICLPIERGAQTGNSFVLLNGVAQSKRDHKHYLERAKADGELYCSGSLNRFSSRLLIFEDVSEGEVCQIMGPWFRELA